MRVTHQSKPRPQSRHRVLNRAVAVLRLGNDTVRLLLNRHAGWRIVPDMKAKLMIAVLAALILPASARVGETVAECDKRYGTPTKIEGDSRAYSKNDIGVVAKFRAGKCIRITYTIPEDSTHTRIDDLLEANVGSSQWSRPLGDLGWKRWKTADGVKMASWTHRPQLLTVWLAADDAAESEKKEAAAKSRTKGF